MLILNVEARQKTTFLTGASSGIGKAAAAARQSPSMQIMSKLPRQMTEDRRSGLVASHLAARLA